jgi:hypothetical protein
MSRVGLDTSLEGSNMLQPEIARDAVTAPRSPQDRPQARIPAYVDHSTVNSDRGG